MKSSVNLLAPALGAVLLSGCSLTGGNAPRAVAPLPTTGPAADYPVVVGEPFTIGEITYEPADTLNYDAVGYASINLTPQARVAVAHKTLPLPSYVEVTELAGGRTILARVEERGPMVTTRLIELSTGAAAQLGIAGSGPIAVRVRRVNPPEQDRALLREGGQAPLRMETPAPLVAVLQRKLAAQEPLQAPGGIANPPIPATGTAPASPPSMTPQDPDLDAAPPADPAPRPTSPSAALEEDAAPVAPSPSGEWVVQAAAFSSEERAENAAQAIGGFVSKPGRYWLLRLGPFATREDAAGALAKARGNGYADARVVRAD